MSGTGQTLPDGFEVRIRAKVRRLDGGRVLLGGSPMRALRLSDLALTVLHGDTVRVVDATSAALAARLLSADVALPVLGEPVPPDRLTVVVPVRDRTDQLDRTLTTLGSSVRVLVVDDASRDPALLAATAARHGAEVLALPTNLGPAGARNAGLLAVRTPYVAFVDSDVTVTADALLRLARHLDDAAVAVVAPLVAGLARSPRPRWFERYDERASSLSLGREPGLVRPGSAVSFVPSACLVARVSALGAGFDATMRVGEDVDLIWRLVGAGHSVRYDPSEVAHHDVRRTVPGWLGRKVAYGTSAAPLAARHGESTAPAVLSPPMAVAAAALLARRGWSVPVAALCLGRQARSLNRSLPPARRRLAVDLSLRGLGWAVRQESSLLLRHWWPVTALACLVSARARRVVLSAWLVDLAVSTAQHPRANPLETAAGRRLDDLAYGTGVWVGCVRSRSLAALRPRWI